MLGSRDLRFNDLGDIDTRITGLLAHWKQQDPPPGRVRPVPLPIIIEAIKMCLAVHDPVYACLADMLLIGFFFVCRPGEYTAGTSSCRPFRLVDATLYHNTLVIPAASTLPILRQATFCTLTFTDQKNGVPGEVIGVGRSGHPIACAIQALSNRVSYLQRHNAPPQMPLCAHLVNGQWRVITATQVTNILRAAVSLFGAPYNLKPEDVSARSLRASAGMAMLCGGVDTARGRLQGRWLSDIMFRYLSVQHAPLCADIASRMVAGGNFDTPPGALPAANAPTILPAAADVAAHAAAVAQFNPQA